MLKRILNLIYPETYTCLSCGKDVFDNPYLFCEHCKNNLPLLSGRLCLHCGEPLVADGNYCKKCKGKNFVFDRAISTFKYDGVIKSLIHNLKYNKSKYVALSLGKFMADSFLETKIYADIIIPVPLSNKRLKERGYNQSLLLAENIGKIVNIPICKDLLIRTKETPNQSELNYQERQKNLRDAFKVTDANKIKGKSILLIDDVYTTGATAFECAKTLKIAKAKTVYVLTASHTLLTKEENE